MKTVLRYCLSSALILLSTSTLLTGCCDDDSNADICLFKKDESKNSGSVSWVDLAKDEIANYTSIIKVTATTYNDKTTYESDWQQYVGNANYPSVDFGRKTVIAIWLSLNTCQNGGDIQKIDKDDANRITVTYKGISTTANCTPSGNNRLRYQLVSIDKTSDNITFEVKTDN